MTISAAISRLFAAVASVLALLLALLMLAIPASAARESADGADIQACTGAEQCTLVQAGCRDSCDVMAVNQNYADDVRRGTAAMCGRDATPPASCAGRPDMSAACVDGLCTVKAGLNSPASWRDYKQPGDDGWTWDSQQSGWDMHGFTAYDLPQELVKQGHLEIRKR